MTSRAVPRAVVPASVVLALLSAWSVSTWFRIPSFDWVTDAVAEPREVASRSLRVRGLKCRHSSEQMYPLLFGRTDERAVAGYLRVVIYPSPEIGEMVVTFDPACTDVLRIARAVRLDSAGLETPFRVLLELEPDRSSPLALVHEIARSFELQNEELFRACHLEGVLAGVDFAALLVEWSGLFLDGLAPVGAVDAGGWVELAGVTVGDAVPLREYGIGMTRLRFRETSRGWFVAEAEWGAFRSR